MDIAQAHIIQRVANGSLRPPIPDNVSPEFAQLLRQMWNENADLRPSLRDVLHNPHLFIQSPSSLHIK